MADIQAKHVKLNTKHRQCIRLLADGLTVAEAAQVLGVGERTVYNWRAKPEFLAALRSADADNLREISRKLTTSSDTALGVLETIMNDTTAPASVRVRAASEILNHRARFYELVNLGDRLADIETRLEQGNL